MRLISDASVLTFTSTGSNIYYTIDGSDPREAQTGAVLGAVYSQTGGTMKPSSMNANCQVRIPTSASDSIGWKSVGFETQAG